MIARLSNGSHWHGVGGEDEGKNGDFATSIWFMISLILQVKSWWLFCLPLYWGETLEDWKTGFFLTISVLCHGSLGLTRLTSAKRKANSKKPFKQDGSISEGKNISEINDRLQNTVNNLHFDALQGYDAHSSRVKVSICEDWVYFGKTSHRKTASHYEKSLKFSVLAMIF